VELSSPRISVQVKLRQGRLVLRLPARQNLLVANDWRKRN